MAASPLTTSAPVRDLLQQIQQSADAEVAGDPRAHQKLLDEIDRLKSIVERPAERIARIRFHPVQNVCIRIALEYGMIQSIADRKGQVVTAAELSKELQVDELLIVRIMRLVTIDGLCEEVGAGSYAANECTDLLVQPGFVGGEKHHTEFSCAIGSKMVEIIRTQDLVQFPDGVTQKDPFSYTFGMPLFKYLSVNKEQKEAFDAIMAARRVAGMPQWFDVFPAEKIIKDDPVNDPSDPLIVDVGGGQGHEMQRIKERVPALKGRLINQDLPETIEPLQGKTSDVEMMAHDFFNEQPVKNAKFYYLRDVMHNWPDDKCRIILSRIVDAMDKKTSRILIDDYVLPDIGADRRMISLDIWMMFICASIERSERQWRNLLGSVGLEIVKVWSSPSGSESIIEAKVKS